MAPPTGGVFSYKSQRGGGLPAPPRLPAPPLGGLNRIPVCRRKKLPSNIDFVGYTSLTFSTMPTLTIIQLKRAVKIKTKLEALQSQLDGLLGTASSNDGTPRRKVSASGRARMAAAQKARWAKKNGKMGKSAAGRARIAAAARARWKAAKAAGRTRL
jgi:hypothetical protein